MITIDEIKERLSYNPVDGTFTWKEAGEHWFKNARSCKRWNTRFAGKKASTKHHSGRNVITINYKKYLASRIAYAVYFNRMPLGLIDHINGNCSDDRIENLREVTKSGNGKNCKMWASNTTGCTGVVKRGKKWGAVIYSNGKSIWLGTFDCKEKAFAARNNAEKDYGFHENHGRAA
jgi:hypothetical protein